MTKTPLWTSKELSAATGGKCAFTFTVGGVSIDTRTLNPGDLFVALEGPNFDGHDFVKDAFHGGAAAALIHHDVEGVSDEHSCLRVEDTQKALENIARAARARTHARIAAVTGSVGKTGTKEALRHVLSADAAVHASEGSLNNHWGLPLSLARMPENAAFGVFEMGMNHAGEISPLSQMTCPHVALITTVEGVHKGHFATLEDIADAKAEIFDSMDRDGAAVLNRDNRFFDRLSARAAEKGIETVIGFGVHEKSEVRLLDLALDADGTTVTVDMMGQVFPYRVGVPGRHWAVNSLGVLATVHALGANVEAAADALAGLSAAKGRGRRCMVGLDGGEFTLIDESYNASPVSMKAAIDLLALTAAQGGGRSVAVLGDMLELGEGAAADHAALKDILDEREIDLVFTAGPLMENLSDAISSSRAVHAKNSEELAAKVAEVLRPGDVVMVKGSAGSRMGLIVDALMALETRRRPRTGNETNRGHAGDKTSRGHAVNSN